MKYLLIILLLLAQHTHAQETDVQRSGLKGPVKWYRREEHKASTSISPLKYDINSSRSRVFQKDGTVTADIWSNMFTSYDKDGMPDIKYTHIAWEHMPRNGRFVERKGYSLNSEKDTTERKTGYYEYDEMDRLVTIRNVSFTAEDSIVAEERYTYDKNGKLDSTITWSVWRRGLQEMSGLSRHTYGDNTDTFSYIDKGETKFISVTTFDCEGRVLEVITWVNGLVNGAEYYFYSDTKTEPGYMSKTHPLAATGADYMYFAIWDKDVHGNYLKKKAHKEDFIQEEEWEIEYYK